MERFACDVYAFVSVYGTIAAATNQRNKLDQENNGEVGIQKVDQVEKQASQAVGLIVKWEDYKRSEYFQDD